MWIPGLLWVLLVNCFVPQAYSLRGLARGDSLDGIRHLRIARLLPPVPGSGTGLPFDGVMNEFFFEDARSCGGNSTILSAGGFTLPLFSMGPARWTGRERNLNSKTCCYYAPGTKKVRFLHQMLQYQNSTPALSDQSVPAFGIP